MENNSFIYSLNPKSMDVNFDSYFHPRAIAVIGASSNYFSGGAPFIIALLSGKYPNLYPINPHRNDVFGIKAYPSLRDVPGPVDYVIIAIPKKYVMGALEDCIAKGVKIICCFSSGYSELGTEEGIKAEKELVAKAREYNIRFLGPNCIGLYCAEERISFNAVLANTLGPENAGDISIISQSGGNTDVFIGYGYSLGLKFRYAVSYGNGADINADELLAFFGSDPKTHLILEYLEGFKTVAQTKNYLRILNDVSKKKPVLMWLGGLSESGSRAIKSHTGSIAGDTRISGVALRQNGAIQVNNVYDLLHTALLISFLQKNGKLNKITPNVTIVGGGGGNSVQYADIFSMYNLKLPPFSNEITQKIIENVGEIGTLLKNPIDLNIAMFDMNVVKKVIRILDENLDTVLIFEPGIEWFIFNERFTKDLIAEKGVNFKMILKQNLNSLIRLERTLRNPLLIVSPSYFHDPEIYRYKLEFEQLFTKNNIPVFSNLSFLGVAISNVVKYQEWCKKHQI